MPAPVICPNCGEGLDIPQELRGTPVRCASCMTVFTPDPALEGETRSDARPPRVARRVDDAAELKDDYDDERPRRRPARKKAGLAWLWILFGGFGLTTCACCGGFGFLVYNIENPTFQTFQSPEKEFSVDFPGPGKNGFPIKLTGIDMQVHECKREMYQELYFVYSGRVDADKVKAGPEALLDEVADELLKRAPLQQQGTRISANYEGYPAMDVTIPPGGPFDEGTIARVILVNDRLYVIGINGQVLPESPRAEHFLSSLKFTQPEKKAKDD